MAGVPIVHRICDAYLLSPSLNLLFARPNSPAALFKDLVRWPHRKLANGVSRVIGLSDAIVELHHRGGLFENTRSHIIPTAVDVAPLQRPAHSGPLRLGFIGQLIPTKGIADLLAGFVAADVDATLDVAGSGEAGYVASLRQRFIDPRIRFVGWVPDKPSFFSRIDLCLVPSRVFDTLPTVVIESFAHHVPVLAASIGGIPEMIVPGRNGLLANLDGAEQVAVALRSAAADPQAIRDMSATTAGASGRYLDPLAQLDRWEAVLGDAMRHA
jgi:glycosyltransferase involved in cell wall biosynthesis